MMLNVGSAMNLCAKYTARLVFNLRGVVSILPTSNLRHAVLSRTYSNVLEGFGTLSARSHQGFNARPKGAARVIAAVIGILLSIASPIDVEASIVPNKSVKQLADKQLTDKQFKCHNEIIFRESSWNINAVGNLTGTKQTHGYYQLKSEAVKGKPYDYQFWMYWYYVAKRYGYTQYEEPNYCAALHHLINKGWA
jgi:hypothetical protein